MLINPCRGIDPGRIGLVETFSKTISLFFWWWRLTLGPQAKHTLYHWSTPPAPGFRVRACLRPCSVASPHSVAEYLTWAIHKARRFVLVHGPGGWKAQEQGLRRLRALAAGGSKWDGWWWVWPSALRCNNLLSVSLCALPGHSPQGLMSNTAMGQLNFNKPCPVHCRAYCDGQCLSQGNLLTRPSSGGSLALTRTQTPVSMF